LKLAEEAVGKPEVVWRTPYRRRMIQFEMARRYARLGEHERALTSLEAAYDNREGNLVFLNVEPLFDALQSNPRFQALVLRIGLKP
jgi:hypothetical protein